jgi:hypothetical protein
MKTLALMLWFLMLAARPQSALAEGDAAARSNCDLHSNPCGF